MIIPVRCFTCGQVIADKNHTYDALVRLGYSEKEALDTIGLTRFCCRRMILTHVDFNDMLLRFNPADAAALPPTNILRSQS